MFLEATLFTKGIHLFCFLKQRLLLKAFTDTDIEQPVGANTQNEFVLLLEATRVPLMSTNVGLQNKLKSLWHGITLTAMLRY